MSTTQAHPPLRGPRGRFPFGHMDQLRRDTLGFLTMCAREYGDLVPLRVGPGRMLLVNDPDLIDEFLVARAREVKKDIAIQILRPLVGNGLVASEGEFWLRQRRMMQPAFHRERVAAYGEIMASYAERTVEGWRDGELCDVPAAMRQLTLEVVCKTLFNATVSGDAAGVGRAMATAQERSTARLQTIELYIPYLVPTLGNLRLRSAVRDLDRVIYRIISERRASGDDPGDLLSILLHARDEDDGSRMTDEQLRDETMTLFLAGHETTAITLTWAWYLLSSNPQVEAQFHAELATVLGGRTPTAEDLQQLPYTRMVIDETLRLYPPVPAMARETLRDIELGGYPVARGTTLLASQWVMHRDSRYWDEPAAFSPERWERGLEKSLPRFAYFPFGGGPRMCIGYGFAIMEAALVLATMAQQVRLALAEDRELVPEMQLTLQPKGGLRMVVRRR